MSRYRLSPAAVDDLDQIWDYTYDLWGADQAQSYVREIQHAIERAANNPNTGMSCDEVRLGYRKLPAGSHLVFYRATDRQSIDVVRILHQRMDPDLHV